VTANSPEDKAILKRHGLFGPAGIFFNHQGQADEQARLICYMPPVKFGAALGLAVL
jgi:thioredoxin:protein disulfide reductase